MLAEQTGAAIAAQGWAVMTGGYGGLMEVTSRAAAQAGGTVIGLPMRGWTGLTPNQWNHELRWSDTYPERLAHLLARAGLRVSDFAGGAVTPQMLALGVAGGPEDVVDACARLIADGARHISFGPPLGPDREEAIRVLASEVIPALR